jgi:hypothetical protein
MSQALVDNDVLLKAAAYGLLSSLLSSRPYGAITFAMLGTAIYVVPKRLKKRIASREQLQPALKEFQDSLSVISLVEPTDAEVRTAADLELAAQKSNLDLDIGESILCAVLIHRGIKFLFTGDKRAIAALGSLTGGGQYQELFGRVACLEQLILWLLWNVKNIDISLCICTKPEMDRSLSNCFGCGSGNSSVDSVHEGIASYTNEIALKAPNILIDSNQFFKNTA